MLHEKLEQASRDATRTGRRLVLTLLGAGALVVLFVLGVIRIDLSTLGLFSDERRPVSEAPPSAGGQTLARETAAPAHDDAADLALREAFKRELAAFESGIEPLVAEEDFARWNAVLQADILARKGDAVARFGLGDYAGARQRLGEAAETSRRQIEARDAAFDGALLQARAAYEQDDHPEAALRLGEALALRPESEDALALKARVDRLPHVLSLIEKAAVARTENDLKAEERHLTEVLAADPTRTALAGRLEAVRSERREADFARHVEVGFAGIEARDPAAAKAALTRATAIFPDRRETTLLAGRITALSRDLEFAYQLDRAASASAADDWRAAEAFYANAAGLRADDRQALQGYALARKINALSAEIDGQLAAPHRLSSPAVTQIAIALVADAQAVASDSPSLADKARRLSALSDSYAVRVPVRVVSDGATQVAVSGVGRVGAAAERTIELRPGRYTFEGTRPGYRSKLVEVEIPPGAERFAVEISCDERV